MAFVYEKLTEQDLEKHPGLNLKGLDGWYIDKDHDVSIWAGWVAQNWQMAAEGLSSFAANLRIEGKIFQFTLKKGDGSTDPLDKPYRIVWEQVETFKPSHLYGMENSTVITILKNALSAWGGGYETNTKYRPNFIVQFSF